MGIDTLIIKAVAPFDITKLWMTKLELCLCECLCRPKQQRVLWVFLDRRDWKTPQGSHTFTYMCSKEKHIPALTQLWPTQISTAKVKKMGHMEAMRPHIALLQDLRDDRECLFTLQWRDEQLVLITGLISRRKTRWGGGGGLSSAPTWTSHSSIALDVLLVSILLCLVTLLQIFCLGRNQSISQRYSVSMCVIRGFQAVCVVHVTAYWQWQSGRGLKKAKQESHWGLHPPFDTAKIYRW